MRGNGGIVGVAYCLVGEGDLFCSYYLAHYLVRRLLFRLSDGNGGGDGIVLLVVVGDVEVVVLHERCFLPV